VLVTVTGLQRKLHRFVLSLRINLKKVKMVSVFPPDIIYRYIFIKLLP